MKARRRYVYRLLAVGIAALGLVTAAAGGKLGAKPITLSAAGAAIPKVYEVVNGNKVPLAQEGPAGEPGDWQFSPVYTAGTAGGPKGVATFFTAKGFDPALRAVLLPNSTNGTTTITLTRLETGEKVTIPVTVVPAPAGDPARGKAIFDTHCVECHGADAHGVDGPNITYTDQGIGGWTIYQFNRAVRIGVDDEGEVLDEDMPRFEKVGFGHGAPTPQEIADIFAYLKTLK